MSDAILRQREMLRLIPRYLAKKTASEIHTRLVGAGYGVAKRTVERDLSDLTRRFPLFPDERSRPFGWSWRANAPDLTPLGLSPHRL